jgi:hypothetical protein
MVYHGLPLVCRPDFGGTGIPVDIEYGVVVDHGLTGCLFGYLTQFNTKTFRQATAKYGEKYVVTTKKYTEED